MLMGKNGENRIQFDIESCQDIDRKI